MDDSKDAPSTAPETVIEMPGTTSDSQHEQSDNISPVPMPENHMTATADLPTKFDGSAPPPYNNDKQQATPVATNPYPGYDPSRIRIAVTPLERLGEVPAQIDCPFCHTMSLTNVTKTDSSQTTVAAVLCCLCCGIITVCLPSWLGWYQNVEHRCGNCTRRVAYKPNDGPIQIETGAVAQMQGQIPQPVYKAT